LGLGGGRVEGTLGAGFVAGQGSEGAEVAGVAEEDEGVLVVAGSAVSAG